MAGALIGGMAAGSAVSGAIGLIGQLSSTAMSNSNSQALQDRQEKFQNSVYDRVEGRFSEAGLPKFMAWMGNTQGSQPNQRYQVSGSNYANLNVPFQANSPPVQNSFTTQASGFYRPNEQQNQPENFPTQQPSMSNYNATPPPNTLLGRDAVSMPGSAFSSSGRQMRNFGTNTNYSAQQMSGGRYALQRLPPVP